MKTGSILRFATLLLATTAATPLYAQSIPDGARLRVTYDGYMEGSAKIPDRSKDTKLRFGSTSVNVPGSRNVQIQASYNIEMTYDGNRVTAVESQVSNVPGVTGKGTFRGTRTGDRCDLITNDGYRITAVCTLDRLEFDFNYTNAEGQEIKSHYVATQTKLVDIAEEERAKAKAEQEAAAARAAAVRAEHERQKVQSGTSSPAAGQPAGDWIKTLDAIVAQDAASWVFNRYDAGSMTNVQILESSADGRNALIYGEYTYNGGAVGAVKLRIRNGVIDCIEFWDFVGQCRPLGQSPSRAMTALVVVGVAATAAAAASSGGGAEGQRNAIDCNKSYGRRY